MQVCFCVFVVFFPPADAKLHGRLFENSVKTFMSSCWRMFPQQQWYVKTASENWLSEIYITVPTTVVVAGWIKTEAEHDQRKPSSLSNLWPVNQERDWKSFEQVLEADVQIKEMLNSTFSLWTLVRSCFTAGVNIQWSPHFCHWYFYNFLCHGGFVFTRVVLLAWRNRDVWWKAICRIRATKHVDVWRSSNLHSLFCSPLTIRPAAPLKPPQCLSFFLPDQWEVTVTQHVSAVKSSDLPVCHIKGRLTFSAVL